MREVEPGVEDKEVDEDLLDKFPKTEFVLPALPVAVKGGQSIHLPQPHRRVDQQAKQRHHAHLDLDDS